MADKAQDIVTASLRAWGLYSRKSPDVHYLRTPDAPPPAAADIYVCYDEKAAFVEVKDCGKSFPFSKWTESSKGENGKWKTGQREWAYCMEHTFNVATWLWLEMGQGLRGDGKRSWLLPSALMLETIQAFAGISDSLPMVASKGYLKHLQANSMDAQTLFQGYELKWIKGVYDLDPSHAFYKFFQPPMISDKASWKIQQQEYRAWRQLT